MKSLIGVFLVAALLVGCSHKMVLNANENKVVRKGVLTVSLEWLKDKGTKFDFSLNLTNDYSKPVVVLLNEMRCFKGTKQGEIRHTFFNTGERLIDLRVGQLKNMNMVCLVSDKVEGEFKIVIGKVYENIEADGKTLGKVLASDIAWRAIVKND